MRSKAVLDEILHEKYLGPDRRTIYRPDKQYGLVHPERTVWPDKQLKPDRFPFTGRRIRTKPKQTGTNQTPHCLNKLGKKRTNPDKPGKKPDKPGQTREKPPGQTRTNPDERGQTLTNANQPGETWTNPDRPRGNPRKSFSNKPPNRPKGSRKKARRQNKPRNLFKSGKHESHDIRSFQYISFAISLYPEFLIFFFPVSCFPS